MLDNFHDFCCLLICFKIVVFKKLIQKSIQVSSNLILYQDIVGPNYLQNLSAAHTLSLKALSHYDV